MSDGQGGPWPAALIHHHTIGLGLAVGPGRNAGPKHILASVAMRPMNLRVLPKAVRVRAKVSVASDPLSQR